MFYVGNTFDEKANKGYKTIQNAKKAAEKDGLSVWDEEGVKLYPLKVEVTDDVPDDAALEEKPDGSVMHMMKPEKKLVKFRLKK